MSRFRYVLIAVALLLLVGCRSQAFGNYGVQTAPVDAAAVVQPLRFADQESVGSSYNVSVTVPESWVGQFEVRNTGNSLAFVYVGDSNRRAPIFYIEALSHDQYWEQIGSYPTLYTNIGILNNNTYFIYYVPPDAYYSGLPKEVFEAFAAEVPAVVASFSAVPV